MAKRTLREFWEQYQQYPDSEHYLKTWHETVKVATWNTPNEIKEFYATITILKNSRVVFNISGNNID